MVTREGNFIYEERGKLSPAQLLERVIDPTAMFKGIRWAALNGIADKNRGIYFYWNGEKFIEEGMYRRERYQDKDAEYGR